jgi:hypothetical protein
MPVRSWASPAVNLAWAAAHLSRSQPDRTHHAPRRRVVRCVPKIAPFRNHQCSNPRFVRSKWFRASNEPATLASNEPATLAAKEPANLGQEARNDA